jgi:hypothetical protein
MCAHLQKAAVVLTILADEDRLHRGLHVVVDAARAGALEERERALVRVEHHLLRLARIRAHEHHPAVAQPRVRDLHGHRHAVQQDDLVTPVELVGFARRKRQRHEGRCSLARVLALPTPRIATNRIVAARIAQPMQILEQPDQRQTFPRRLRRILSQHPIQVGLPTPQFGLRLNVTFVGERRLPVMSPVVV